MQIREWDNKQGTVRVVQTLRGYQACLMDSKRVAQPVEAEALHAMVNEGGFWPKRYTMQGNYLIFT